MNPPQNVTSRYVRNLLVKGKNNEFELTLLQRQFSMTDQLVIGSYYIVTILNDVTKEAVGVTPEQAIHRCLEKHGVTFR